jgi:topoisomerase-4 subunit B
VAIEPDQGEATTRLVDELMGNRPEARFSFIQERAEFAAELDI